MAKRAQEAVRRRDRQAGNGRDREGHARDGLEAEGVPSSAINRLDQVFEDPQVIHRDMRIRMEHAATREGGVCLIGNPIHLSATPISYREPPPVLGEHTASTLREILGLSDQDLAWLRREQVI